MKLPTLTIEHGDKFGRLTVLRQAPKKGRGPRYVVGCACGHQFVVKRSHLVSGKRTACDKCEAIAL